MISYGLIGIGFFVLTALWIGNYSWLSSIAATPKSPLYNTTEVCSPLYTAASANSRYYADGTSKHYQYNLPEKCNPSESIDIISFDSTNTLNTGIWYVSNISSSSTTLNISKIVSSGDGSHMYAAVFGDYIYHSTDQASTWHALTNASIGNWVSIACSADGNILWAAQNPGYLYLTTNAGVNFTRQSAALVNSSRGWQAIVTVISGDLASACAIENGCYTTTDNGSTWTRTIAENTTLLSNSLCMCTIDGTMYAGTNMGFYASGTLKRNTNITKNIVCGQTGANSVYATENGYLMYSTNNGLNWTAQITNFNAIDILSGIVTTSYSQFVATRENSVYMSFDTASTWYAQEGTAVAINENGFSQISLSVSEVSTTPVAYIFATSPLSSTTAIWKNLQTTTNQRYADFVCQACGDSWFDVNFLLAESSSDFNGVTITDSVIDGSTIGSTERSTGAFSQLIIGTGSSVIDHYDKEDVLVTSMASVAFSNVSCLFRFRRIGSLVTVCWTSMTSYIGGSLTVVTAPSTIPPNFRSTIVPAFTYPVSVQNLDSGNGTTGFVIINSTPGTATLAWQQNINNPNQIWENGKLLRIASSCISYVVEAA